MCLFDSTWVPAYVGIPWTRQKGYTLALRNGLENPFIYFLASCTVQEFSGVRAESTWLFLRALTIRIFGTVSSLMQADRDRKRPETATSVPSLRVIRYVGVTSLLSISDSLTLLCARFGTCGDRLSFCLLAQY
jgi:hypothetical protein